MLVAALLSVDKYYLVMISKNFSRLLALVCFIRGGKPFISPQAYPFPLITFHGLKNCEQLIS